MQMKDFFTSKQLVKGLQMDAGDYMILLVFFVYLLSNVDFPMAINDKLNTTLGNLMIVVFAIMILGNRSALVGVFGLIVAYEMINRVSYGSANMMIHEATPEEDKKKQDFNKMNQNVKETTLEENIVNEMKPYVSGQAGPSNVKPILSELHQATTL